MNKGKPVKDDDFWAKCYYAQPLSSEEMEQKKRTFHMKHDEEMDFECRICKTRISAHSRDWHGGMCDGCFNREHYQGDKTKE